MLRLWKPLFLGVIFHSLKAKESAYISYFIFSVYRFRFLHPFQASVGLQICCYCLFMLNSFYLQRFLCTTSNIQPNVSGMGTDFSLCLLCPSSPFRLPEQRCLEIANILVGQKAAVRRESQVRSPPGRTMWSAVHLIKLASLIHDAQIPLDSLFSCKPTTIWGSFSSWGACVREGNWVCSLSPKRQLPFLHPFLYIKWCELIS